MSENALCPQVVYVCPACGWWKAETFQCQHMVDAVDGEPAFRNYSAQRTRFYLWDDVQELKAIR